MDPPAWKETVRYEDDSEDGPMDNAAGAASPSHPHDEEPRTSQREAAAHGGVSDNDGDDNTTEDEDFGPKYKDQVRPAAGEVAAVAQPDGTIPLAESVHIMVTEEVPADPPTLPAVAFPAPSSGISAKNTLGSVAPVPYAAKPAASTRQLDNSDNVSENMLDEDSEDEQKLEEGPTDCETPSKASPKNSNKPNSTANKIPHVPPKAEVNKPPGILTSNKQHSSPAKSPQVPPRAVVGRQLEWNVKSKIWAGFLVLVVVIIVAVVAGVLNKKGGGSKSPPPTTQLPSEEKTDPPTQDIKLMASDGVANDRFGTSVAIDGDTMVIGAPEVEKDNDSGGRAYVYIRSSSRAGWTEQAKLLASDGASDDEFGESAAIFGDTMVIGAPERFKANDSGGRAYVYTRSGTVWTEQTKLTASDGAASDRFGNSVAMDGDTMVIGAPESYKNNDSGGRAYVYISFGTVWTEEAKLTASDGAPDNNFGWSVAMDGDTIVIGNESGSTYVYTRSSSTGTVWTEQTKLMARLSNSVAIDGNTIVIGADEDDNENGEDSGSAYVYIRSGTVWTEQAKLTGSDSAADDRFGTSVAIDGDTIAIGANRDDTAKGLTNRGSVYLFTRNSTETVWTEQEKFIASDTVYLSDFGISVAMDEGTIFIGAVRANNANGVKSGSVYIFVV